MKKILSLLALVLMSCMGAWADEIRPTYVSSNTTKAANDGEHASKLVDATGRTTKWGEGFTNGETTLWIIVRADNAVLKSYTLTNGNDTNTYPGRRWASWTVEGSDSSDENGSWSTIDSQTDATVNYATQYASTTFDTSSNNTAYSYYKITLTKINGEGANATMQQMGDLMFNVEYNNTVTATYNYKYNNVTKHSETVTLVPGNAFTDPATAWSNMPYGLSCTTPQGTVPEVPATSYDIELTTANYPFAFSDSYASANWTVLRVRPDNGYRFYLKYDASASSNVKAVTEKYNETNADAYSWAFVGNPFDGFKVYNKATGESMVWSTTSSPRVMKNDETKWILTTPWDGASNTAYTSLKLFSLIPQDGSTTDRNNINNANKDIRTYDGNDQGSAFWTEPLLVSGRKFVARNVGNANRYAYFSSSASALKNDANRNQNGKQYLILYPHAEGGYYIYNATEDKVVGKTGGSNSDTPTVDREHRAEAGRYSFNQVVSNNECTSYFSIHCDNGTWDTNDRKYWHINNTVANGKIVPWEAGSSTNTSSEWIIEDEGMATDAEMAAIREFLAEGINVTINYTAGDLSWNVEKEVAEGELTAADVAVDFYTNFNITTVNKTVSESNKAFDVTCEEDFPFTVGQPTRIQNAGHADRMDFYVDGTDVKYITGTETAANNSNLWSFEHASATDPYLFTVKNFGTGKYLTFNGDTRTAAIARDNITGSETADITSYVHIRKGNGGFCIQHPKYPQTCCSTHITESSNVGGWGAADETTALKNADNALKVLAPEFFSANLAATNGTDYYGSIYLPYTMTLPEGVEAYAATQEGVVLKLTKVGEAGAVVPEGAYILYGGTSVTSAVLALGETATESAGSNALTGKFEANVALPEGNNYVLNDKNSVVGFYKYTKTIYPVAKAVFCAGTTASSASFAFRFEDILTAIDALHSNNSNAEIYDLQGRRLNKAQQGMNIINGHKVLVK